MQDPKTPPAARDATVISQLRKLSDEKPDKPAFVFIDAKWNRFVLTRKEVWDLSRQYANVLTSNGLKKGDVLCNCLVNSPERLLTTFGTIIAGGISLHGKIIQTDGSDLLNNLNISKCTTVLLDPGEKVGAYPTLKGIEYLDKETGKLRYKGLPCLVNVIHISVYENASFNDAHKDICQCPQTWLKALPREKGFHEDENVRADDIAVLSVTSGTTGLPKMLPYTHKMLLAVNWASNQDIVNERSVYFNDRCLGWPAGAPTTYLDIGNTRVLSDLRFQMPADEITRIYDILVNEKCDCATLTPVHLQALVNMVETKPAPSIRLRRLATSGAPFNFREMSKLWRVTDVLAVYYGATECNFASCVHVTRGEAFENSSIGKPFPGVEMRVVDDQQQDLPDGALGEILVRSHATAKGYYNQPEKDKGIFLSDGWIKVGDVGFFDTKGHITLVNRKSDGIVTISGVVYPGLIETRLAVLPGVQGASLIGIPQRGAETGGTPHEEICACICLLPESTVTEEDLRQFCQDFRQSTTKTNVPIPDYFLFFDEFPYLVNGKLSRIILKEQVLSRLNMR